ncbi:unnamed protein product [marine sediment metagenome]|uniref:Phage protein Gp37/Gp68 n=1 Tax=marine sediment metagenome TaxID=412755 RepID=X1EC01_9ZZZZ
MFKRFHPNEKFNDVQLLWNKLKEPFFWKKPQIVATCFTSDLFQKSVTDSFINNVIDTIYCTSDLHSYILLTKRAKRACDLLKKIQANGFELKGLGTEKYRNFLENIWLGATVEHQDYVERAENLRTVDIDGHKWLSFEPLLGPIDPKICKGFDWVVVGGESGSQARYMEPKWVYPIRDYCLEHGILFYFKQWGNQKKGYILDGQVYRDIPFSCHDLIMSTTSQIQLI